MPSVQRGSGSRDPPELLLLLLHFSKCWWLTISVALRLSNSLGVEQQGRGWKTTKCLWRRGIYPIYIGERGQPPIRGAASPYSFSPLHGGGNPLLHGKVTPPHQMSNPHFNFA
jgi:hypothetical protein